MRKMTMLNPIMMHEVAKARQHDVLKGAEARRLARLAKADQVDRPSLPERLTDGLGTLLIGAGERLKERQASAGGV
jgi:hypothetical protein